MMLNIRCYKEEPTTYVFRYQKGAIKQQGREGVLRWHSASLMQGSM